MCGVLAALINWSLYMIYQDCVFIVLYKRSMCALLPWAWSVISRMSQGYIFWTKSHSHFGFTVLAYAGSFHVHPPCAYGNLVGCLYSVLCAWMIFCSCGLDAVTHCNLSQINYNTMWCSYATLNCHATPPSKQRPSNDCGCGWGCDVTGQLFCGGWVLCVAVCASRLGVDLSGIRRSGGGHHWMLPVSVGTPLGQGVKCVVLFGAG